MWISATFGLTRDLHRNVWFFKNRKMFVPCFLARFLPFGYCTLPPIAHSEKRQAVVSDRSFCHDRHYVYLAGSFWQ